jgi:hypothetical protein
MRQRIFTLQEASDLIPWVDTKLAELASLENILVDARQKYTQLLNRRNNNGHSSSEDDIETARKDMELLKEEFQKELDSISKEGILIRHVQSGLIDFPCLREGREIYLCWIRGESEIGFWHEINVGYSDRQSL